MAEGNEAYSFWVARIEGSETHIFLGHMAEKNKINILLGSFSKAGGCKAKRNGTHMWFWGS